MCLAPAIAAAQSQGRGSFTSWPATSETVVVRYADGAGVHCVAGACRGLPGVDVDLLGQMPPEAVQNCYGLSAGEIAILRERAQAATGAPAADLGQCFSVRVPLGAAEELATQFARSAGVEDAYRVFPVPPPELPRDALEAPDLSGRQWHLDDRADGGLGVRAFWDEHGVFGQGVTVVDVEVAFDGGHEDLTSAIGAEDWAGSGNAQFPDASFVHHSIAAFGMIIAQHNGFGVQGIAPDVRPIFSSQFTTDYPWGTGASIARALQHLAPGDVILLEVQVPGPRYVQDDETQFGLVPAEWQRAEYDIIRMASDLGIIVVEAAGNGQQDLDDPIYEGRFDRQQRDSGALVVCASNPPSGDAGQPRAPAAFTNRGSRCDLQGYGYQIVTTGYGDLRRVGDDHRQAYTAQFGGTSGASPMVAGVAALLQSMVRADGQYLPPSTMREILIDSGLAQARGAHIGPLPDALAGALLAPLHATAPPEAPEGPPGPGQRCEEACAPGSTCTEVVPGESYCLSLCEPFSDACGEGNVCQLQRDATGMCVEDRGGGGIGDACSEAADCAVNHTCSQDGRCWALCSLRRGTGCPEGAQCQAFQVDFGDIGFCLESQRNPDGAEDGAACTESSECQGGYCVTEWPDGYCLDLDCSEDADCHGPDSVCLAVDLRGNRYCFDGCERHADCRFGYNCDDGTCRPGDPTGCVSDEDCPSGAICNNVRICEEGERTPEPEPEPSPEPEPDVGPEPEPDVGVDAGADLAREVGFDAEDGAVVAPPPPRASRPSGCL